MAGRLVLVRHAKSDYPWGVDDHDRPLNQRGRRDAPRIGAWLEANVTWPADRPPAVRVSTARRAQATWAAATAELDPARWAAADVADEPRIYEADVATLVAVAAQAARDADDVLLVGHNPGLADLIAALAVDDGLRAQALAKYPTSAIAVLTADESLTQALARLGGMRVSAFAVPRG